MEKGIDLEDARRIFLTSAELGIVSKLLTFSGYPGETVEDMLQTSWWEENLIDAAVARPEFTMPFQMVLYRNAPIARELVPNGGSPADGVVRAFSAAGPLETVSEYRRKAADAALREGIGRRYADNITRAFEECALALTDNENMTFDLVWADLGFWGFSSGPALLRHRGKAASRAPQSEQMQLDESTGVLEQKGVTA